MLISAVHAAYDHRQIPATIMVKRLFLTVSSPRIEIPGGKFNSYPCTILLAEKLHILYLSFFKVSYYNIDPLIFQFLIF